MFQRISEAYDTLSDPSKKRDYDNILYAPTDRGASFSAPQYRSSGSSGFSNRRAQDIFDSFFNDFHNDMFSDPFSDPFFSAPLGGMRGRTTTNNNGNGHRSTHEATHMNAHHNAQRNIFAQHQSLFGQVDDLFAQMHNMPGSTGTGFATSSSTTTYGSGQNRRSVSTRTTIDNQGRKTTRTETTVYRPDGTVDTNVSESIEEPDYPSSGNRLQYRSNSNNNNNNNNSNNNNNNNNGWEMNDYSQLRRKTSHGYTDVGGSGRYR